MEKLELFEFLRKIAQSLSKRYLPEMDRESQENGLAESEFIIGLLPAMMFDPGPISADHLRVRTPYASPKFFAALLESLAGKGSLVQVPEGGYGLTPKGLEQCRKILQSLYRVMESTPALPLAQAEEMALLLSRLVQASILTDEIEMKWSILHSRRIDPGRQAHPMVKIDQYISDLAAYRDDAHLSAWKLFCDNAHAWELFTLIWNSSVLPREELLAKVSRRQWEEGVTRISLEELEEKGWIKGTGILSLTHEGLEVRNQAEKLTNDFFFAPWQKMSGADLERLGSLAEECNRLLEPIAEKRI